MFILGIFSEATLLACLSFVALVRCFLPLPWARHYLGYHRLLTHKSLKVPRWLMYFIVSGGYLGLMGSPIVWVGVHRLHHQKSDLDGDPHSPKDGFKHALYGWMFDMRKVQSDEELQKQVPDLMANRLFPHARDRPLSMASTVVSGSLHCFSGADLLACLRSLLWQI